jgi:hypothetical protein
LAFLWGEELPAEPPAPGPTPAHHLDYFQHPTRHDILRGWLDGEHVRYARRRSSSRAPITFVDLTPPWMGGFHVAKAMREGAAPLSFGLAPVTAHLPASLRMHPIA